jgi:hypothetical protein
MLGFWPLTLWRRHRHERQDRAPWMYCLTGYTLSRLTREDKVRVRARAQALKVWEGLMRYTTGTQFNNRTYPPASLPRVSVFGTRDRCGAVGYTAPRRRYCRARAGLYVGIADEDVSVAIFGHLGNVPDQVPILGSRWAG